MQRGWPSAIKQEQPIKNSLIMMDQIDRAIRSQAGIFLPRRLASSRPGHVFAENINQSLVGQALPSRKG